MSYKYLPVIACIIALSACSDSPEEPAQASQQIHVGKDPSPVVAAPSPDDHSARFEFYFNGQLKGVYRGTDAASPQKYDEFTQTDFTSLVAMMDKRPVNTRSARVANLLRGLDKIPENARANAFEARAKQLVKETPHTLTKLSDGTRVIEYRFDGQLASRVVIPATVTFASAKPARVVPNEPGLIARDVATGDGCSDCWTEADEIYYWGIITYAMDQGAAIDYQASDLVLASPVVALDISSEGNCLSQYKDFLVNTAEFAGIVAGAGANWEGIAAKYLSGAVTAQQAKWLKIGFAAGVFDKLQSVWNSYNTFHDCLWAWKRG